jgi:hypothetical protein
VSKAKPKPNDPRGPQVEVKCSFTKMMPTASVKPNPKNPSSHNEHQVALLARIIQSQGWRLPITVSKRSGYVVRGHARLAAGKLLGCKTVPVDLQDYASAEQETADMIADNRIAELAETDADVMREIMKDLGSEDLKITGYEQDEIEKMMKDWEVAPPAVDDDDPDEKPEKKKTLKCPKCGHRFKA